MTKRILEKLAKKLHLYRSRDEDIEELKNLGMKVTVIDDEYENICPRCGANVVVRDKPHSVMCACTVCKWKGYYPLVVHKSAGWYMTQGFAGPQRGLPG